LEQQTKNYSPHSDCSGDDDRISEECIPLKNYIKEAMAMLENEKSSEQSKPICEDQFSIRKNVKIKLFKKTSMPKENRSIKTIEEELLEHNCNDKQLKLAEKK
jgi:hypothetical protein